MKLKRVFDIVFSFTGLLFVAVPLVVFYVVACTDTRQNGLFCQKRIGRYGKPFTIYKLKSMTVINGVPVVTRSGRFMRKYKIDELPQLINVLKGDMSIVGPRPDVPGYYDALKGTDRQLLTLRPGITGPANIKYRNEEYFLSTINNPLEYNDSVIFPDKVRINLIYLKNRSFLLDLKIILYTVMGKEVPGF